MAGIVPPLVMHLVFLLLYAACGVVMVIKLRGASAVLGGIGWALLCFVVVLRIVVFEAHWEHNLISQVLGWTGLITLSAWSASSSRCS
jgi:hypothetical protein